MFVFEHEHWYIINNFTGYLFSKAWQVAISITIGKYFSVLIGIYQTRQHVHIIFTEEFAWLICTWRIKRSKGLIFDDFMFSITGSFNGIQWNLLKKKALRWKIITEQSHRVNFNNFNDLFLSIAKYSISQQQLWIDLNVPLP